MFEGVRKDVDANMVSIQSIHTTIHRLEQKIDSQSNAPGPPPMIDLARLENACGPPDGVLSRSERSQKQYDISRKALRLWPVSGKTDSEIRTQVIRFIREKLKVSENDCPDAAIGLVRRTQSARGKFVNFEVLVSFEDKHIRDKVSSHGRNLSPFFSEETNQPTAGMRMEYPEYLATDYRILE